MKVDLVPLIVGLIGAGGLGAFVRELISGITKVLGGMSARESKRKVDIVQQRDEALSDLKSARDERDSEAEWRRVLQEYCARLRVQIISAHLEPLPEPPRPT